MGKHLFLHEEQKLLFWLLRVMCNDFLFKRKITERFLKFTYQKKVRAIILVLSGRVNIVE